MSNPWTEWERRGGTETGTHNSGDEERLPKLILSRLQRPFQKALISMAIGHMLRREFDGTHGIASVLRKQYRRGLVASALDIIAWIIQALPPISRIYPWLAWLVKFINPDRGQAFIQCMDRKVWRIISRLTKEAVTNQKQIGILGADAYTQWFLRCTPLAHAPISWILDEAFAKQESEWCGYHAKPPENIADLNIDYLFISTPEIEKIAGELIGRAESAGIQIVNPFPPNPPELIPEQTSALAGIETTPHSSDSSAFTAAPAKELPLVAYLARRAEGPAPFVRFINSYREMQADMPHELLVIFKGFRRVNELAMCRRFLSGLNHLEMETDDTGYDIGSYLKAYRRFNYSMYLFLGSYCTLRAPGWLAKMVSALKDNPYAGIVAASGSWGPGQARLFPNFHIRTSAFLIRRDTLSRIKARPIVTKHDAYLFEHGRQGLTQQILQMGLEPYVVGKDGRSFRKEDWARQEIFFVKEQSNLLISDNQTDFYDMSDKFTRKLLASMSWLPPTYIHLS